MSDAETLAAFCFYCDAPLLPERVERDHMPKPKRHGGTTTVDSCEPCHDLKDRVLLGDWPINLAMSGAQNVWSSLSRAGRLWLAKAYAVVLDAEAAQTDNPQ